jgi:glycosyltransferase involved in cell wall biosynthesis
MRIALLGTRGIPANYGGFETFAEELATRLAARGHTVTVYCRERYPQKEYRGVRLQYLPTIRHKYLDTLAHTFFSTLHLLAHRADVALYCNGANAIFTLWPRIFGVPVALNVDGIERKRKKWNRLAKAWYLVSEWLSTFLPSVMVTDARTIERYYRERYGKLSVFISYGAAVGKVAGWGELAKLDLEPGR